jgi:uncharacterized protein
VKIEGSRALVTGASSGIGRATALELAKRGADLVIVARRSDLLESAADEIRQLGRQCTVIVADLSTREGCTAAAQQALEAHSSIDILVNNAGFALFDELATASTEDLRSMMDLNYFAALDLTQALLPQMISRRSGAIVNIASIAGIMGFFRMGGYCATKFAMVGMSEAMRDELYPTGVRVSLVCPGTVETDFFVKAERRKMPSASRLILAIKPQSVARAVARAVENGSYRIILPAGAALFMKFKEIFPRTAHALMRNVSRAIEARRS